MAAASMVRVSMVPLALQDLSPYSAEGTEVSEPELVSLPQTCQETKFDGGQAPTRAGQYSLQRPAVAVGQPTGYY